eukprot:67044-Chlamydomonas_euryale.AAC.1
MQAASASRKSLVPPKDAASWVHEHLPENIADVRASPDRKHWQQAMREEMAGHVAHGTWRLDYPPVGTKALGARWVFDPKRTPDGGVHRFKARLVIKGYNQRPGRTLMRSMPLLLNQWLSGPW